MLYIFDKDNTLVYNHTNPNRPPNNITEQKLIPGVAEDCFVLGLEGNTLAVASNQGGVAYGFLDASSAHLLVRSAASAIGAEHYAVCVTHPDGSIPALARESRFRKPEPGMLLYLMDALGFAPEETVYVGDRCEDRDAAARAKVSFRWAWEVFKRPDIRRERVKSSTIAEIGYSPIGGVLEVKFKSGGTYRYGDVQPGLYQQWLESKSLGAFFHEHIKNAHQWAKIEA
jgi:HAD superfamily hydrolase (TIGR01662 family)